MRALLAIAVLLAVPSVAAARPLDADRGFARDGVFLLQEPYAASSVLALSDGGTLHVTDRGQLRLTASGRDAGMTQAQGGYVKDMTPGLAVGHAPVLYGEKTAMATWRLGDDGAFGPVTIISLPGSVEPLRVVRRRGGYVVLTWSFEPEGLMLVALTPEGALDTIWGENGVRRVRGDWGDLALGAAPDGSLIHAMVPETRCERRGYANRRERAVLRAQRFGPTGTPGRARRFPVGAADQCPMAETGEALVDGRGRAVIAGQFGTGVTVLRLKRDLRRDRRFTSSVHLRESWSLPARLERWPGRGYALGYTSGANGVPRGAVALIDYRGRRRAHRRLKVTKGYPTSDLRDLAFDRRRRLVVAGSLRDQDTYIREDYGAPHLAIWRLRTR